MKDKKFIALSVFFFLLFIAGTLVIALEKPVGGILRAKDEAPSPLKSFVVIFPQVGVVDSSTSEMPKKLKVIVSMRDINGSVLPNRQVKLGSSLDGSVVSPSDTLTTDDKGQAQFTLSSTSAGDTKITVTDVRSSVTLANIPSAKFSQ